MKKINYLKNRKKNSCTLHYNTAEAGFELRLTLNHVCESTLTSIHTYTYICVYTNQRAHCTSEQEA